MNLKPSIRVIGWQSSQRVDLKYKLKSIKVNLDLVNYNIFKPHVGLKTKDTIFIYNGLTPGKEYVYGVEYYMSVLKKLPQYKVIYSNNLNVDNLQMPSKILHILPTHPVRGQPEWYNEE